MSKICNANPPAAISIPLGGTAVQKARISPQRKEK